MKLKLTFEVECFDTFINPNDQEEREWLFNTILKIDSKDWAIISGEIGDELGVETRLDSCSIIPDGVPAGMELICSNCNKFTVYDKVLKGKIDLSDEYTKDINVCPNCFANSTLSDVT